MSLYRERRGLRYAAFDMRQVSMPPRAASMSAACDATTASRCRCHAYVAALSRTRARRIAAHKIRALHHVTRLRYAASTRVISRRAKHAALCRAVSPPRRKGTRAPRHEVRKRKYARHGARCRDETLLQCRAIGVPTKANRLHAHASVTSPLMAQVYTLIFASPCLLRCRGMLTRYRRASQTSRVTRHFERMSLP